MDVRFANHNRTFDVRQSHSLVRCDFRMVVGMDGAGILEALKRHSVPHERIAAAIGRDRTAATKLLSGVRSMKAAEVQPLLDLLAEYEPHEHHIANTPDLPGSDPSQSYVAVEVLPTFAGMGGGGTGEGDRETALVSRRLVEEELRARPQDLLLINVRGNSMEPLFFHGDQLLVDRRDRSPTQPGPFALLFDDGYVVKNVAWVAKRTKWRVSSANAEYAPEDFDPEEIAIMGRPVWFARRL